jgi:hypothetical protein
MVICFVSQPIYSFNFGGLFAKETAIKQQILTWLGLTNLSHLRCVQDDPLRRTTARVKSNFVTHQRYMGFLSGTRCIYFKSSKKWFLIRMFHNDIFSYSLILIYAVSLYSIMQLY